MPSALWLMVSPPMSSRAHANRTAHICRAQHSAERRPCAHAGVSRRRTQFRPSERRFATLMHLCPGRTPTQWLARSTGMVPLTTISRTDSAFGRAPLPRIRSTRVNTPRLLVLRGRIRDRFGAAQDSECGDRPAA
jgi:hypothetical protein